MLPIFFLLGVLLVPVQTYAAEKKDKATLAILEGVGGDGLVAIHTPEGHREAKSGTALHIGDWVKTGERATAKIRYVDGSAILIGRSTEFEIREKKNGIQLNDLHFGEVRGIITKPAPLPSPSPDPDSNSDTTPPRKFKFLVKNKSAVLGVRGTDFVFDAEEAAQEAEIHTLDGTVEVAHDEPSLLSGKGVAVNRAEVVTANSQTISVPESFDRENFIQSLEDEQPDFQKLIQKSSSLNSSSLSAMEAEEAEDRKTSRRKQTKQSLENKESNGQVKPRSESATKPAPIVAPKLKEEREQENPSEKKDGENSSEQPSKKTKKDENTKRFRPFQFRLNGLAVFRAHESFFASPEVSWNPYFAITTFLGLTGNVGFFSLNRAYGSKYLAADYELFVTATFFESLSVDGGGGFQAWYGHAPSRMVLSLNGSWIFDKKTLGIFDRVFVGISGLPFNAPLLDNLKRHLDYDFIHEYKVGVGISF